MFKWGATNGTFNVDVSGLGEKKADNSQDMQHEGYFEANLHDRRDIWYDSKLHTGNFIDGTWKEIWYYNYMTYTRHSN